jgi:hypothetical protein
MDDGRQLRKKDIAMLANQDEVPADKEAMPAAIARCDATI